MVLVIFELNPDGTRGRWVLTNDLVRTVPESPEFLAELRETLYSRKTHSWVLYINGPRSQHLAESNPELFDEITTDVKVLEPANGMCLREIISDDKARSWLIDAAHRRRNQAVETDLRHQAVETDLRRRNQVIEETL
jgi:hypothetical protein